MGSWTIDQSRGELLVRTGVTGRAARLGHRLTIVMNLWTGEVTTDRDVPTEVQLTVEVDSLEVRHGEGGAKGLSGPEKAVARSNALRCLHADRHPQITFHATEVSATDAGYRLTGDLTIHGQTRPTTVEVTESDAGEQWELAAEATVAQRDFGVKPYSLMMGSVKVADEVTVSFSASQPKAARLA